MWEEFDAYDTKKKDFFIHVNVISKLFMCKFLCYLKKSYRDNKLKFPGLIQEISREPEFQKFIDNLYRKKWVVYCKPPFGGAEQVLEYVGRYTHRVAISNTRIIKMEDEKVTFRWKDYKDNNMAKQMTVTTEEFIRRFLLHILPDGFVKIRYYGILSSRNKQTKLKKSKELLLGCSENGEASKINQEDLLEGMLDIPESICLCCKKGMMRTRKLLLPDKPSPPRIVWKDLN